MQNCWDCFQKIEKSLPPPPPKKKSAVYSDTPIFGDHLLVIAELSLGVGSTQNNYILKRDWRSYSNTKLNNHLARLIQASSFNSACDVQSIWNLLENVLIKSVDAVAPLML